MKKLLLYLFLMLPVMLTAQETNWLDRPYIEVYGDAKEEVVPNEIFISISIQESDIKNKKTTVETLERNMVKALERLGINTQKDLAVRDMNSSFKHYWIRSTEIQTGKNYLLKVDNAVLAGRVFQSLESLGISQMNIERVDHSDIEAIQQAVKEKAVKNGKTKADALAAAIGQNAGKALYIRETNQGVYYPNMLRAQVAKVATFDMAVEESAEPELEFEKIVVEYKIFVCFELN